MNEWCFWPDHIRDCVSYREWSENPVITADRYMFLPFVLSYSTEAFGYPLTIKAFMLVSNMLFLVGVWLLLRKRLDARVMIFTLVACSFSMGLLRIWIELYRNWLVIMLAPYFFYWIEKERHVLALACLGVALVSHHSGLLLLGVYIIYLMKAIAGSLIIGMGEFEYLMRHDIEHLLFNIQNMIYYNSIYLLATALFMRQFRMKDTLHFLAVSLFLLCVFSLPFYYGHRTGAIMSLPCIIMTALFVQKNRRLRKIFYCMSSLFILPGIFAVAFPGTLAF